MAKQKRPSREQRRVRCSAGIKAPTDWLRFIQEDLFEKCWGECGLNDEDMQALETLIMANPDGPPVISGTGGIRKIRFAGLHWDSGKSSGARIYYLYVPDRGIVFLLFAHLKGDRETISDRGKQAIRGLVTEVLSRLEQGGYDEV